MTDGQDVRALLKSIGGLKRRMAEMDRQVEQKLTLDNDTFENTGKSRFFERRTSRVLY